jgi:hypothetical protein
MSFFSKTSGSYLMKLQLKLIAAAALIAVAGSASAKISTDYSTTGGELVFFAWDSAQGKSYQQDLGISYGSFLPGSANLSFNISVLGQAWTDYMASVGGTLAGTKWGVTGIFAADSATPGQYGLLTTVAAGTTAATLNTQTTKPLVTAIDKFDANFKALNNKNVNDQDISNNASFANAYNYKGLVGNTGGGLVFKDDNAIGTKSSFEYLLLVDSAPNSRTSNTLFAGTTLAFDGTTVSAVTAAVPEPTTYAMMIAGLMLVGGIARRRNSAK